MLQGAASVHKTTVNENNTHPLLGRPER